MNEDWSEGPKGDRWSHPEISSHILAETDEGRDMPIPREWSVICARRIRDLRRKLEKSWIGLDIKRQDDDAGGTPGDHLLNWMLACLVARENVLLLGEPGVAKTEIAEMTFRWLGLIPPQVFPGATLTRPETQDFHSWWDGRVKFEKKTQKYFRYLLSRFTQPDELFGPIEINLLRQGILAYINFGMLTGPGVRGAFLDEVFKASASILNTLLTLTQEREYFNLGGMVRSDLVMFIGASNELPGGFASGTYGLGTSGEDFNLLHAFLDRFPVRIQVPLASGAIRDDGEDSDQKDTKFLKTHLSNATQEAIKREGRRLTTNKAFEQPQWEEERAPSINDLLLLGRSCLEQEHMSREDLDRGGLFDQKALADFKAAFYEIATSLQGDCTEAATNKITWTISPRKLKALYKIALAHAVICDDRFDEKSDCVNGPGRKQLHVFDFIWDTQGAKQELETQVNAGINLTRKRRT